MEVNLFDIIGRRLFLFKVWEPRITKLLIENAKPNSIFLDVGAHWGYYSLLIAKKIDNKECVIAYEPNRNAIKRLRKNIEANQLSNHIIVMNRAVSDKNNEYIYLNKGEKTNSGGSKISNQGQILSKTITLNDLPVELCRRISVIKIDVEGAEDLVLRGASKMLKEVPKGTVMIMEITFDSKTKSQRINEILATINEIRKIKDLEEIHTTYSISPYFRAKKGNKKQLNQNCDKTSTNYLVRF